MGIPSKTLSFILTICAFMWGILTSTAEAQNSGEQLQCFEFISHDSPQRIPEAFFGPTSEPFFEVQTWCYSSLKAGELFVFNNDEPEVRPELSLLIQSAGKNGEVTFTQGTRAAGRLALVKSSDPGFSPFNVPLTLEEAQQTGREVSALQVGVSVQRLAQTVIEQFRAVPLLVRNEIGTTRFEEHDALDASLYPYNAYWWPHSGVPLGAGEYSPLGKYDRAMAARTGRNPGAADWERREHSLQNVAWGGHCNGWAASSVLYDKWASRVWDEKTQTVIMPSDVDGIRAEASFCVDWAFYGQRYRGSGDDISDIHADRFHKVLRYYLRNLKKPIATDYVVDVSVDNNVITGYRSEFTEIANRPGWYDVNTELQMHNYNYDREESSTPSDLYSRRYAYRLQLDAQRNILAGEWVDNYEHPDFLWVPLAQKKCGRENPAIDHVQVETWLASLPLAERRYFPLNLSVSDPLPAGGQLILPLPQTLVGNEFEVEFGGSGYEAPLAAAVRGLTVVYPRLGDSSPAWYWRDGVGSSPVNLDFRITNMDALVIANSTSRAIRAASPLVIKGVWYWGAPTQGASH